MLPLTIALGVTGCEPEEWESKVLVVAYYSYDETGLLIDPEQDPAWAAPVIDTLNEQRGFVSTEAAEALVDLEDASRYHGYADPNAEPTITYTMVDYIEKIQPKPWVPVVDPPPGVTHHLDYQTILEDLDICTWVETHGVDEVWLFKSVSKPGYRHDESKLTGPHGNVGNAWVYGDMPVCASSYRVYTHDMNRWELFLHVWGHQHEAELRHAAQTGVHSALDMQILRDWHGPCYDSDDHQCSPPIAGVPGRCGSVHFAPNSLDDYDVGNPTPWTTDCPDWDPEGLGPLTSVSCATWGCGASPWTVADNPESNWQVWLWQNLPARYGSGKQYGVQRLRNWWSVHGDFDRVVGNHLGLTEPFRLAFVDTNAKRDGLVGAGWHCVSLNDPSEPPAHGWSDNYLCSQADVGLRFGANGYPAGGGTCLYIQEIYDTPAWINNAICTDVDLGLMWSPNGPIGGKTCIKWDEPNDANGWSNNHLCW